MSNAKPPPRFRFRLSTLLLFITAMAFVIELIRTLAGISNGLFFTGMAFVYAGVFVSVCFISLGYSVGQRAGATAAMIASLAVCLGPLWSLGAFGSAVPEGVTPVRWLYTLFVLIALGATLWSVWREEPDGGEALTLPRLRQVKQEIEARERKRKKI